MPDCCWKKLGGGYLKHRHARHARIASKLNSDETVYLKLEAGTRYFDRGSQCRLGFAKELLKWLGISKASASSPPPTNFCQQFLC